MSRVVVGLKLREVARRIPGDDRQEECVGVPIGAAELVHRNLVVPVARALEVVGRLDVDDVRSDTDLREVGVPDLSLKRAGRKHRCRHQQLEFES